MLSSVTGVRHSRFPADTEPVSVVLDPETWLLMQVTSFMFSKQLLAAVHPVCWE